MQKLLIGINQNFIKIITFPTILNYSTRQLIEGSFKVEM